VKVLKSVNKISSLFLAPAVMAEIAMGTPKNLIKNKNSKFTKILFVILGLVFILMLTAVVAHAADTDPLSQIDLVKNNKTTVDQNTVYKDLNSMMNLIYVIAGFISLVALVTASILLSTSGGNPQRRAMGFTALGMALLGGWVLYKAASLAQWLGKFGAA
jgi:hypothetical protein